MKIYLVRNKIGQYLHVKHGHMHYWVSKDEADLYHTAEVADYAGNAAFDWDDDARKQFTVEEIDTDAALDVLRDLFAVHDLGDYIYDVREREGLGWHGPQVTKWGDAVDRAKTLLEKPCSDS